MNIQTALSELLASMGFDAMARDVLAETDGARIQKYARIVAKNAPANIKPRVTVLLQQAGLLPGAYFVGR